jgi:hypothetical protein
MLGRKVSGDKTEKARELSGDEENEVAKFSILSNSGDSDYSKLSQAEQ